MVYNMPHTLIRRLSKRDCLSQLKMEEFQIARYFGFGNSQVVLHRAITLTKRPQTSRKMYFKFGEQANTVKLYRAKKFAVDLDLQMTDFMGYSHSHEGPANGLSYKDGDYEWIVCYESTCDTRNYLFPYESDAGSNFKRRIISWWGCISSFGGKLMALVEVPFKLRRVGLLVFKYMQAFSKSIGASERCPGSLMYLPKELGPVVIDCFGCFHLWTWMVTLREDLRYPLCWAAPEQSIITRRVVCFYVPNAALLKSIVVRYIQVACATRTCILPEYLPASSKNKFFETNPTLCKLSYVPMAEYGSDW